MADVSFAHVSHEGFAAFRTQLTSGEWENIDVSSYIGADGRAAKPLGDAPLLVDIKLQLIWVINDLVDISFQGASAKEFDEIWDVTQKRLNAHLVLGSHSKDPAQKAAALRLQKLLLLGNGEGQTKLKYQQEVDFGRQQVEITSGGRGALDVALLGLSDIMAEIAEASEALATAIGYGATTQAPNQRKRAALSACSMMFAAAAQTLLWLSEYGMDGSDKPRALALRSTLVDLAARYPAPAIEAKKESAAPKQPAAPAP